MRDAHGTATLTGHMAPRLHGVSPSSHGRVPYSRTLPFKMMIPRGAFCASTSPGPAYQSLLFAFTTLQALRKNALLSMLIVCCQLYLSIAMSSWEGITIA